MANSPPILRLLAACAALLPLCACFSVTQSNDANVLANAIFSQPGVTVLSASFTGATVSSGTFTDGPFGIGSGGILTSGAAVGALPSGDHYVNNGAPGSDAYCGTNTFNAAILSVDFTVDAGYNGVEVEFIMASEEEGGSPDPIGIFVGSQQYAVDWLGNRFTAVSPFLASPLVIKPPNSVTSYPGSSPPLLVGIPLTGAQTMIFAICDKGDALWDSAVLFKAGGCTDCDPDVRLAYVTTTTTVAAGSPTFTSTTTASGTVSGTILIGASATETTTTTTEETTTTTTEETTSTTTEETTTTTTEETTTTTEETTTTTTEETTTTTTDTTTTEEATTTSEEITTSTSAETTTTTSEDSPTTTESTTSSSSDLSTTANISTSTQEISSQSTSKSSTSTSTSSQAVTSATSSSLEIELPASSTASSTSETTFILPSPQSSSSTVESTSSILPFTTSALNPTTAIPTSNPTSITSVGPGAASNLPTIEQYKYYGCLGSAAGYPSFNLIGRGPDMTTVECIRLAVGYRYVGLFDRDCYAAETLDSATRVLNGRCDRPCPGDEGLYCGGVIDLEAGLNRRSFPEIGRRAAPPNVLLSLYEMVEIESERLSETSTLTMSSALFASETSSVIRTALPIGTPYHGRPPAPIVDTVTQTEVVTETARETIVTSVTYTVVNPSNPAYLIVTEFRTTMEYYPCHRCKHQSIPQVEWTTIETTCNACGFWGEDTIILTIPMGAVSTSEKMQDYSEEGGSWVQDIPTAASGGRVPSLEVASTGMGASAEPTIEQAGNSPEGSNGWGGDDRPSAAATEEWPAERTGAASGSEGSGSGDTRTGGSGPGPEDSGSRSSRFGGSGSGAGGEVTNGASVPNPSEATGVSLGPIGSASAGVPTSPVVVAASARRSIHCVLALVVPLLGLYFIF